MKTKKKLNRILLKFSGEMLYDHENNVVMDFDFLKYLSDEIKTLLKEGVKVGLVVGGGNIWRFRNFKEANIQRATSDYMGILATMINGLGLKDYFKASGIDTELFSAIEVAGVIKLHCVYAAQHAMNKGQLVVFCGGTGSPYFTTDSQAALRACELNCDAFIKATKVDGVYDSDPEKNPKAKKYSKLTYNKVISDNLSVMDLTAVSLCKDNNIPVYVLSLHNKRSILDIVKGKKGIGTLISN